MSDGPNVNDKPPSPPPAYSVGSTPSSDTSQPRRLTVETDADDQVWAVCSCGWVQAFPSGVAYGEFGYHVGLHADTHRKNPRNFLADLDEPQYDRVERPAKPRWWQR